MFVIFWFVANNNIQHVCAINQIHKHTHTHIGTQMKPVFLFLLTKTTKQQVRIKCEEEESS